MKLYNGVVVPYTASLSRPYVSATAEHTERRGLICHLVAREGVQGLGEAAPLSNRTEPLERAERVLEAGVETLTTAGWEAQRALGSLEDAVPELARAPTARHALSLALHDLIARGLEAPLAGHLAAQHLDGRTPASRVPVNATVPADEPDAMARTARGFQEEGFTTIKLKSTGDPPADVERVGAVREAVGSAVELRLDVNGAWPTVDEALRHLDALAPYELAYVEQPLPPDAIEAMARLRERSPVPIAADEPVVSPEAARRVLEAEAADVLVLKPMVLGGPEKALAAARAAEAAGVPVVVTSTIDGAIARAGALHTASALGETQLTHACGLATGNLIAEEPAAFDERIEDGWMPVPEGPGHGARRTGTREAKRGPEDG